MNNSLIYRAQAAPLTNDQMRRVAPSIFAERPWHAMSDSYAFIPTIAVVDKMRSEGFQPFEVRQSRSRVAGKQDFTRHMIRFRDMRSDIAKPFAMDLRRVGEVFPELVLTNAHDGASRFKLMSGLFRLICENGLVIGDGIVHHIGIAHRGGKSAADAVIEATYQVIEDQPKVMASIEGFQALRLEAPEQRAFATAALALKYDGDETPVTAEQIIRPKRYADQEPTLWNTYNVVQEHLVNGGDHYRGGETMRRQRTRPVQGISENTRLNAALWTLAEEMRKLRG